jgi:hypothetical protein
LSPIWSIAAFPMRFHDIRTPRRPVGATACGRTLLEEVHEREA